MHDKQNFQVKIDTTPAAGEKKQTADTIKSLVETALSNANITGTVTVTGS
jgi:hypothetical protein